MGNYEISSAPALHDEYAKLQLECRLGHVLHREFITLSGRMEIANHIKDKVLMQEVKTTPPSLQKK